MDFPFVFCSLIRIFAAEMTKRREKAKPQKPELNKQLAVMENSDNKKLSEKASRMRTFMYELGKFMVDIAKLVFAGVIIAGIMNEEIDRRLLFLLGSSVVIAFALLGLIIISNNKEGK